jgi:uncharacterized protein YbjT (DUF2867 family)
MPVAFVAGATGYTGREVVRTLIARGVVTIAHVRADSADLARHKTDLAAEGATVDVTPWDETQMTQTLHRLQPSHVFALLGTTRERARAAARNGKATESYETVDYGLTAMLLRASVACGSRPRFVYLSALGAGRPSKNPYYTARFRLEGELRQSGLPFVIARPALVTGADRPENRAGERAAARVSDALLAIAGHMGAAGLRDTLASLDARTLAAGLVALALDPETTTAVADPAVLRARARGAPRA